MAFYLHLGPFAQKVIGAIDTRLAELDLAAEACGAPVAEVVGFADLGRPVTITLAAG
jgi:hypothetical protein